MVFLPAIQAPTQATPEGWHFVFFDGKLLVAESGGDVPPLERQASHLWVGQIQTRHYLGQLDGHDCWAMTVAALPLGWQAIPLRAAMMKLPEQLMMLAARAAQIVEWDRAHRYCGVCAAPTELQLAERARICPACKHTVYPRLSPAMMVLIHRGKEVLLARAPHFATGMYSALAGFVEAGETLEECVHREVMEEVGVRVANLRYYGSQSWPFPHSLMVAFTAEWVSGEIVPQPGEIEHAAWFPLDALPGIPPRFSIAGHLIRDTIDALQAQPA
ncbi:NAD(+) diphosphatase [Chitinimonas sp.]|uniref:NAD(+) diphosphatase n=1 Tax=Chitinimonas sp. TaxID=1934313 RepID=UPI002F92D851